MEAIRRSAAVARGAGVTCLAGATVGGPLACTGNTPAQVNDGVPNPVRGPATGQCRGL